MLDRVHTTFAFYEEGVETTLPFAQIGQRLRKKYKKVEGFLHNVRRFNKLCVTLYMK